MLTLSFTLRSAPRSCSSLTASRCPPRQAQCTAVQSSWTYSAVSWWGTSLPCVCPLPQQVPVLELNWQNPACSYLRDRDSTAPLQGPQYCCSSGCTTPRCSDKHAAGSRIQPYPVPEVNSGPTVQQLLQDFHVSLQRGAVQGCAVELGDRVAHWRTDASSLAQPGCTSSPVPGVPALAHRHGGARLQDMVAWHRLPGKLPHHMCRESHRLPETSR